VSAALDQPMLFAGDEAGSAIEAQNHAVEVRTIRSPNKETPNEDAALVMPVGHDGLVLAVADGVGGSPAGHEAARMVVSMLADALSQADVTTDRLRSVILDTLENATATLLESGRRSATTLVVAEIVGRQLRSYHVGDSELIAVGQRGRIKARIIPHSPTGFAVEAGLLGEDEAVRHEHRHILFNVIGAKDMRVDISTPVTLAPFDTVLLASDGLVDNLFVDEIIEIMRRGPLDSAVVRLVQSARKRMLADSATKPSKPDDLTVILCRKLARTARGRRKRSQGAELP
jgi:serine/threonine protein phosphatase PrpC